MLMSPVKIAALSLIPSILICVFVYIRDKKEKEPLWLLALLFAVSAAVYVPVYFLGDAVTGIFDKMFESKRTLDVSGMLIWADPADKYYNYGLNAFVGKALIEEAARWLVLYFITSRSKHFNCLFDGVIYSVFVSMGAALSSNIVLAMTSGWELFILKFIASFPWYLFFGIIMGIFYTAWHTWRGADKKENRMIKEGGLKKDRIRYPVFSLILGILVPTLLHGVYCYADFLGSPDVNSFFVKFAAVIFIACVCSVFILSKKDKTNDEAIDSILKEAHDEYEAYVGIGGWGGEEPVEEIEEKAEGEDGGDGK